MQLGLFPETYQCRYVALTGESGLGTSGSIIKKLAKKEIKGQLVLEANDKAVRGRG